MTHIFALAIALVATVVGCGAEPALPDPPDLPDAAQLIDDVRAAMEAAPTFRFEGEQRVTTPLEGEMDVRHTGEASGDAFVFLTESIDETSPRQGGVSYVGSKAYSPDGRYSLPSDVMQSLTETPRSLLLPPEELANAAGAWRDRRRCDGLSVDGGAASQQV